MNEKPYMESFFRKHGESNHKPIAWDYNELATATESFLSDLSLHIKKMTGIEVSHDDERLIFTDSEIESLDVKIHQILASFPKNVILKYRNNELVVAYNNCIIGYNFSEDDFGNTASVIYESVSGNLYDGKKVATFIRQAGGIYQMQCGANFFTCANINRLQSIVRSVFGSNVVIKTKMYTMYVEFPETYSESTYLNDSKTKPYMEASLSDSEMFQNLNKSSAIISKVGTALKNGVALDKTYIEEQYLQIEKAKPSPLSDRILKAFDDGRIKLIYNKKDRVTTAVPFIVVNVGGKPTACIFVADFAPMNKEGTQLSVDMKKLYTLMESGYVGLNYFSNPAPFLKNGGFMKIFATVYAEMYLRILNREYALSLDKSAYDTINYIAARFCLTKILGLKSVELAKSYAEACCKSPDRITLELADGMYDRANIQGTEDLIKLIASTNAKMSKLTFRYFFERWISSFGTGACLGIDSFPYLYYIIANVLMGGFLVNVTGLSEIVKNTKGIATLYSELSHMVN